MKSQVWVVGLALVIAASAEAEVVPCEPIETLPYVIDQAGNYCLKQNLSIASGTGITIGADNVMLDFNGFSITGPGGTTTAIGVSSSGRQNVKIRNGTIGGFYRGVFIQNPSDTAQGISIEAMRIQDVSYMGIAISGNANIVRANHITGAKSINSHIYGIYSTGAETLLVDNDVSDVAAADGYTAHGIYIVSGSSVVAADNRIGGISGSAGANAIYIRTGTNVVVKNNSLAAAKNGIYFYSGSSGEYTNNVTYNVATPYSGGTAVGPNY